MFRLRTRDLLFNDILGIEKKGKYRGDLLNRCYVLASILEKYPEIQGAIEINKNKNIEFKLQKGKKKLSFILISGSLLEYKVGRKKVEGVFFNRRIILPLLEELNNE